MPTPLGLVRQAGVIALRGAQVCLVSSRGGKRWVTPKGNMEPGKSACEVALQEAWEEAGLVGLIGPDPVGSYFYEKDGLLCHVLVFRMKVTDEVDLYPEAGQRQRVWVALAAAPTWVEDAGLRDVLTAVAAERPG